MFQSDRTLTWFLYDVEFEVLRVWGEMRRGGRPPRLLSGLLSGDKANWLGDVQATAVGSSGWRGWSDTGRRPPSPCCIHWTLLPAKYRRAAALTRTLTDIHTLTGTTSRRRLLHHTPSPSKLSSYLFSPYLPLKCLRRTCGRYIPIFYNIPRLILYKNSHQIYGTCGVHQVHIRTYLEQKPKQLCEIQ